MTFRVQQLNTDNEGENHVLAAFTPSDLERGTERLSEESNRRAQSVRSHSSAVVMLYSNTLITLGLRLIRTV